ncbi:MAG: hypothetical protein PVI30_22580 [Myxococcales bacterium]|jgi:hypothetical protein
MDEHDAEEARRRRAAARRAWPVRRVPLTKQGGDDLSATTTVEQRLAMVWRLTVDAWASSGRPFPTYTRDEAPGRLRRLGDG